MNYVVPNTFRGCIVYIFVLKTISEKYFGKRKCCRCLEVLGQLVEIVQIFYESIKSHATMEKRKSELFNFSEHE